MLVFTNGLTLGGTEKAACHWARVLRPHGHDFLVMTLADGPRRAGLESTKIPEEVVRPYAAEIARIPGDFCPDVIHARVSGYPHPRDVPGDALKRLPRKIPVVQTKVFGLYKNPAEDQWTDFRWFISGTSCVQAARRIFRRLDGDFFRRANVVAYPLAASDIVPAWAAADYLDRHRAHRDTAPRSATFRSLQWRNGCWRFNRPAGFRTVKRHKRRAPADWQSGAVSGCAHQHQFGHSLLEQMALRPFYYRARFHQFRHRLR